MEALQFDGRLAGAYLNSPGACSSDRPLLYGWPGCQQLWSTAAAAAAAAAASSSPPCDPDPTASRDSLNLCKPHPGYQELPISCMPGLAALQQQHRQFHGASLVPPASMLGAGTDAGAGVAAHKVEPMPGMRMQDVAGGGAGFGTPASGFASNAFHSGPLGPLPVAGGTTPFELPSSQSGSVPQQQQQQQQQQAVEYWQQAIALAAMHRAAAAGQVAGAVPLYANANGLGALAGSRAPPAATHAASMIQDEKELKRQRRKLSNRESARRSRLRKQAELHSMVKDVRSYSIKNAHLKLELEHLRACATKLREQNATLEGMLGKDAKSDLIRKQMDVGCNANGCSNSGTDKSVRHQRGFESVKIKDQGKYVPICDVTDDEDDDDEEEEDDVRFGNAGNPCRRGLLGGTDAHELMIM